MLVSVETTGGLGRRATVAVPSAQLEAEVATRLKEAAGDLKLPGFRPGKVPMTEVRRRLGPAARNQAARNLAIASFSEAMRDQPFTIATQAQIEIANLNPGADLEFTATFEVLPEVQLAALDSLNVRQPQAVIADADIDSTIEEIRRQRTKWTAVQRPAQEGDRVVVDLVWRRGEDVEREREGVALVLDDRMAQWKQALIGLAADAKGQLPETVSGQAHSEVAEDAVAAGAEAPLALGAETPPPAVVGGLADDAQASSGDENETAPSDDRDADAHAAAQEAAQEADDQEAALAEPAAAHPKPASEPSAGALSAMPEFTLRSVEAPVLPAVDDDLFDWFGVATGEDRLAKFRAAVRERMEVELQAAVRRATSQEVLAVLVEAHEFELPPTMVRTEVAAELERLAQVVAGITPEVAASAQRVVERRLRAQLVMREVVSRQAMTPDDKRVGDRIDEIASAYEEPAQVRRALYSDEAKTREIEQAVLEEQVIEHVLARAQVAAVDMPYRDLVAGRQLPERPAPAVEAAASEADGDPPRTSDAVGAPDAADDPSADATPVDEPSADESSGWLGKVKRLFARPT